VTTPTTTGEKKKRRMIERTGMRTNKDGNTMKI
jgi:hypothetical protein